MLRLPLRRSCRFLTKVYHVRVLYSTSRKSFQSVCSGASVNSNIRSLSSAQKRPVSTDDSSPYDPLAKRPNRICDPYGQKGKPLSLEQAQGLLSTLQDGWKLEDDSLVREFYHRNYLEGAKFVSTIAAVAHMNNHYPTILLERRLFREAWQVTTLVQCKTPTLGGLSFNDFHIAMLMDVELERPEVHALVLSEDLCQR